MLRLWRFLPAGTKCHPTIWAVSRQQGFRLASSAICKVQRLCEKLEQLQSRVVCPKRTSFTERGEVYQLPLKMAMPRADPPARTELEYLVGFFDGDGSVSLDVKRKSVKIQVDQNIDSARILFRYRDVLGGSVSHARAGTGRKKSILKWQLSSNKASAAATLLASVPSMKQAQLEIAARGKALQDDWSTWGQALNALKGEDHVPVGFECSWPYFAGFFDAEGCISLRTTEVGMILSVGQKNQSILSSVHDFLQHQGLTCHLYAVKSQVRLQCMELASCKRILKKLLLNGLDVKKEQAQLALTLTATNHFQLREQLSKLKGYQGRYQRLDEAGIYRSKEIGKMRRKLRRPSSQQDQLQMEEELQALLQEHSRENLLCKTKMLKLDIRKLLREGATIQPLDLYEVQI